MAGVGEAEPDSERAVGGAGENLDAEGCGGSRDRVGLRCGAVGTVGGADSYRGGASPTGRRIRAWHSRTLRPRARVAGESGRIYVGSVRPNGRRPGAARRTIGRWGRRATRQRGWTGGRRAKARRHAGSPCRGQDGASGGRSRACARLRSRRRAGRVTRVGRRQRSYCPATPDGSRGADRGRVLSRFPGGWGDGDYTAPVS